MCCGRKSGDSDPGRQPEPPRPEATGDVLVRYRGPSAGVRMWQGISGRFYRFGGSAPLVYMAAEDAARFTARGLVTTV